VTARWSAVQRVSDSEQDKVFDPGKVYGADAAILQDLYNVIEDRTINPKEGSYTNYLLDKGLDKILKKVGEEATEVVIAAKNKSPEEIRYETADLLYHLTVLMVERGIKLEEVFKELKERR
jgi:phosphoribosyl-ATP pyrophosphohydrolase/phosphoribosyl-AMP cyclohydrolase